MFGVWDVCSQVLLDAFALFYGMYDAGSIRGVGELQWTPSGLPE